MLHDISTNILTLDERIVRLEKQRRVDHAVASRRQQETRGTSDGDGAARLGRAVGRIATCMLNVADELGMAAVDIE